MRLKNSVPRFCLLLLVVCVSLPQFLSADVSQRGARRTSLLSKSRLFSLKQELQQQDRQQLTGDSKLKFITIGDWGCETSTGTTSNNQAMVAKAMTEYARKYGVNFIVSVGDNFYERGVTSLNDPKVRLQLSEWLIRAQFYGIDGRCLHL